ncbi:MAG: 4-(cytidine 5'-diphospho)-2-C-methyl-D-erythritol kinase [Chthoniobacterales bacterium]
MTKQMEELAHAKINLSLRVLRRREDGFHEIRTLIAPITLCDSLEIRRADAFEFGCTDPTLPADEENLVVRAARLFFTETGCAPKVRIVLQKRIPHGAGLGGGSSDAAATLRGLNKCFDAKIAHERLLEMAAKLGSDVPFFIQETTAICRGRGEIVRPVELSTRFNLLLLKPEFPVATAWAYSLSGGVRSVADVPYQRVGRRALVNHLERPVFGKFVFLARLKMWLLAQPEVAAALLSGSGSTVFAVLRDAAVADGLAARARAELDPNLWACACEMLRV